MSLLLFANISSSIMKGERNKMTVQQKELLIRLLEIDLEYETNGNKAKAIINTIKRLKEEQHERQAENN